MYKYNCHCFPVLSFLSDLHSLQLNVFFSLFAEVTFHSNVVLLFLVWLFLRLEIVLMVHHILEIVPHLLHFKHKMQATVDGLRVKWFS